MDVRGAEVRQRGRPGGAGCDINVPRADAILKEVRAAGGEMVALHPARVSGAPMWIG